MLILNSRFTCRYLLAVMNVEEENLVYLIYAPLTRRWDWDLVCKVLKTRETCIKANSMCCVLAAVNVNFNMSAL